MSAVVIIARHLCLSGGTAAPRLAQTNAPHFSDPNRGSAQLAIRAKCTTDINEKN